MHLSMEKKKIERKLFVPYEYWEADMKPQNTCACLHFPYTMALRNASSRQAAAAEHQQCVHWVHINPSAFIWYKNNFMQVLHPTENRGLFSISHYASMHHCVCFPESL